MTGFIAFPLCNTRGERTAIFLSFFGSLSCLSGSGTGCTNEQHLICRQGSHRQRMYYPEPPHCGELWSTAYPAHLALGAKERPSRCCFLHQNMKALGRTVERWKGKVGVASPSLSPWSPIGLTPSGCRFLEWWDAGKGLQEGAGCF